MEITIKLEGVEKALKHLDSKRVVNAARAAINDVAKQGLNEASRIIRTEYNIKAGRLKQYLTLTSRARNDSLHAVITGKGLGIPRAYFAPRQEGVIANKKGFRYTGRAKRTGGLKYGGTVTTLVKLSQRRKAVPAANNGNKPFIAKMRSGHIGVFYRVGKAKLPIETSFAVGIGGLFGTNRIINSTKKVINEKFAPRFYFWLHK